MTTWNIETRATGGHALLNIYSGTNIRCGFITSATIIHQNGGYIDMMVKFSRTDGWTMKSVRCYRVSLSTRHNIVKYDYTNGHYYPCCGSTRRAICRQWQAVKDRLKFANVSISVESLEPDIVI